MFENHWCGASDQKWWEGMIDLSRGIIWFTFKRITLAAGWHKKASKGARAEIRNIYQEAITIVMVKKIMAPSMVEVGVVRNGQICDVMATRVCLWIGFGTWKKEDSMMTQKVWDLRNQIFGISEQGSMGRGMRREESVWGKLM